MRYKIETKNLTIDPELCKRLDKNFYSKNSNSAVIAKSKLYREELLDLIRSYNSEVAEIEKSAGLFRLCTIIQILQLDFGKHDSERCHANMQTAHNQLANYK